MDLGSLSAFLIGTTLDQLTFVLFDESSHPVDPKIIDGGHVSWSPKGALEFLKQVCDRKHMDVVM
jgi:hypothetical protein